MDRFSWTSSSNTCVIPGESGVHQQSGIRIYDGDKKVEITLNYLTDRVIRCLRFGNNAFLWLFFAQTTFENGTLKLTTHRIVWDDLEQQVWCK